MPLTFLSSMDIAPGWEFADRDAYLRTFWRKFGNDMLQAVLAVSIAKIQTQNWELEGPEELAVAYHRILRDESNFNKGYGDMVARGVMDYYTQDNGWFMERQRSGPNDHEGPMLGLAHLDSNRMKPTGNAEFPYMYNDEYGAYHLMHYSQFIRIVDMPTPETTLHGTDKGFCALSRALSTSIILMLLVTMKREKLADLPPSAMAIFNNINRKQFEQAMQLYGAKEDMKGNVIWRQLMPMFGIDPAHPASIQFISLREVWEGYDDMTAMNVAAYSFAAAWRIDPREFWPVSQGPLGTGKEAEVQHQKAKSKSTGLLFTEIERAFNANLTLPPGVTYKYALQDADEEEQRTAIHNAQVGLIQGMQNAGAGLVPCEVRWLLANQYRILPRSLANIPQEGDVIGGGGSTVWMDDVDRQSKEYGGWYFGPPVRIDQDGRKMSLSPYALPDGVKFIGEKGGAGSGHYGHAGRPGLVGGSGGGEDAAPSGEVSYSNPVNGEVKLVDTYDQVSSHRNLGSGFKRWFVTQGKLVDMAGTVNVDLTHLEFASTHPEIFGSSMSPKPIAYVEENGLTEAEEDIMRRLVDDSNVVEVGVYGNQISVRGVPITSSGLRKVQNWLSDGKLPTGKRYQYTWESRPGSHPMHDVASQAVSMSYNDLILAENIRDLRLANIRDLQLAQLKEFAGSDHAVDMFPMIIQQLQDADQITFEQACKASLGTADLAGTVSDAARKAALAGQDVVAATVKELVTQLSIHEYHLGDKEVQAMTTARQKIASLPGPTACTVRANASRLGEVLGESRKRRYGMLEGIPDAVWNEASAKDEAEEQSEENKQPMAPMIISSMVGMA